MNKIAIISESPSIKTGFGATTAFIAKSLLDNGFSVACFGLNQWGEGFNRDEYGYRIWAVGGTDEISMLRQFIAYENPCLTIINFDFINAGRWLSILNSIGYKGKVVGHIVIDGTPICIKDLSFLKKFDLIIVPTNHSKEYLKTEGIENVSVCYHGIDENIFKPLDIEKRLRVRAKLNIADKFIIGCFGRNTERKQQPRLLQAIKFLVDSGINDIIVYFHCNPYDNFNSWNLPKIAEKLGVEDYVLFQETFNQFKGIVQKSGFENLYSSNEYSEFSDLSLVDRIGICDICVNIPFCGGFELLNVEIQACGVPLVTTNDFGNIKEVVGEGAYLLTTNNIGIWRTGAYQYLISPEELSKTIIYLKNDNLIRHSLALSGLQNSQKYNSQTQEYIFANLILNQINVNYEQQSRA